MKRTQLLAVCFALACSTWCFGQGANRRGPGVMDVPNNPQKVGETGIAWYTTWESGLAEAKRSNRPIFFMSAATTCSGVSGVF